MSVGRICTRAIATASPNESIRAAAQRMATYDVGKVVEETEAIGRLLERQQPLIPA
jgi:hypothetical protein